MREGEDLVKLKEDLSLGEGLGLLSKNREPNQNGVAYGGVALLWREECVSFQEVKIDNPSDFEVLVADRGGNF